jgi:glyoxylase I family protein
MTRQVLQIRGLDHLLLIVDNMDTALAFYCGVLGCTIGANLPQYGMAELRAGDHGLDLVDAASPQGAWARAAPAGGRNLDHFCLAVEVADQSALRAHLAAHAATITEERREDGFLSLYVRDPCGNVVELKMREGEPRAGVESI